MKIILASSNPGKIKELQAMLKPLDVAVVSQAEYQVSEVAETGKTFIENALIKARHACESTSLPALADDSGLVVPALAGAPGIFSARYAGEKANAQDNIDKLLNEMKLLDGRDRSAYFYCALVFLAHADDPTPLISVAKWQGEISATPCGTDGFGYDPVFYLASESKTAAELAPEVKNTISHRGKALLNLTTQLKDKLYECTFR